MGNITVINAGTGKVLAVQSAWTPQCQVTWVMKLSSKVGGIYCANSQTLQMVDITTTALTVLISTVVPSLVPTQTTGAITPPTVIEDYNVACLAATGMGSVVCLNVDPTNQNMFGQMYLGFVCDDPSGVASQYYHGSLQLLIIVCFDSSASQSAQDRLLHTTSSRGT